jgi:hypothetical protein
MQISSATGGARPARGKTSTVGVVNQVRWSGSGVPRVGLRRLRISQPNRRPAAIRTATPGSRPGKPGAADWLERLPRLLRLDSIARVQVFHATQLLNPAWASVPKPASAVRGQPCGRQQNGSQHLRKSSHRFQHSRSLRGFQPLFGAKAFNAHALRPKSLVRDRGPRLCWTQN